MEKGDNYLKDMVVGCFLHLNTSLHLIYFYLAGKNINPPSPDLHYLLNLKTTCYHLPDGRATSVCIVCNTLDQVSSNNACYNTL